VATPKASEQDARNYYAGEDADGLDVEVAMNIAANVVASLSDLPDEPDSDYEGAARLGELSFGRWFWTTGSGTLTSKSLSGVNAKTYAKLPEVRDLVSAALGDYYKAPGEGESSDVAYVSRFPF
jgi:hypothetical protein